jgi:Cu2+-exporting ATPase
MKTTFFALVAALMLFTACGSEKSADDATQQETIEQGDVAGQTTYYCPMKCEGEKTYAEMGSCAVCGMDLVETGSHDGHDHGSHDGHDHGSDDAGEEGGM